MYNTNQLPEHTFSNQNPGAFQAQNGIANLFNEFDQHFTSGISNTHPLVDEENPAEIETKYSKDYNDMVQEFGNYSFHIVTNIKKLN